MYLCETTVSLENRFVYPLQTLFVVGILFSRCPSVRLSFAFVQISKINPSNNFPNAGMGVNTFKPFVTEGK